LNPINKKLARPLSVESLECRLAPAAWPIAGGPAAAPVVGVYGQYQDLPRAGWDETVRLGEGLAVAAPAGTTVRPAAAGTLVEVHRAGNPYDSFVVVRETVPAGQAPRYWAYHHVQPPALTATTFGLMKLLGLPMTVGASDSLGQVVATPAALQPEVTDHVRVELGTALVPQNGVNYVAPALNPLAQFGDDLDATAPTIDGLTIRRADDEGLGETKVATGSILSERPRTTSHYYGPAAGSGPIWVGRRADTADALGNPAAGATGVVDLVVRASDGFAAGADRLGVYKLGFAVAGQTFGAGTGYVPAVEFAAVNPADFATAAARRTYENDWRNDSGAAFHYTVTNAAAAPGTFDAGGWNTQARAGFAWNDKAEFAAGNADAAFPDDVYDVTVTAADESGNVATRTFPVLVDNWDQAVAPGRPGYAAGEPIDLTGGGYRAGQAVPVYLLPAGEGAAPAAGTPLAPEHLAGTATADQSGRLDGSAVPGGAPAGAYWVVTDYDGDGVYTREFDGAAPVRVDEQQLSIAAADDVLVAALDPDTYEYFVPAPGVFANDDLPAGVPVGATGAYVGTPNEPTADINPDGSITIFIPIEPFYVLPLVFEYQAYYDPPGGGPRVYSDAATVTLYLDDGSWQGGVPVG
jgi:hypothetical protein